MAQCFQEQTPLNLGTIRGVGGCFWKGCGPPQCNAGQGTPSKKGLQQWSVCGSFGVLYQIAGLGGSQQGPLLALLP